MIGDGTIDFIGTFTIFTQEKTRELYRCTRCGAVVERADLQLHGDWHAETEKPSG